MAPLAVLTGCYQPPGAVEPRAPMTVAASVEVTRSAATRWLAGQATGPGVTGPATTVVLLTEERGLVYANCGSNGVKNYIATHGVIHLVLAGDSARSSVQVVAEWTDEQNRTRACQTTGVFEREAEQAIRQLAEAR